MNIHFWNTTALAGELAQDTVHEREGFLYFLANTVLWTGVLYYSSFWGMRLNWMAAYELGIVLVITVFGLFRCYEANGGADGRQFVLRATCLSFPVGLKVNIISIVSGLFLFYYLFPRYIDTTLFRDPGRVYELVSFAWVAFFTFLFYWRLWHHLAVIRKRSTPPG